MKQKLCCIRGENMRIDQQQKQQNSVLELLQQSGSVEGKGSLGLFSEKIATSKSKQADRQSVFIKDSTYLNPALQEKDDLAEDIQSGLGLDATARKNQMAVLSHTTSEEDYAKMQEEGFALDETTSNTIVTVTDKIKMQIAKAGGDISCFGDDLDTAQLEELTGNKALARQIEQALKDADLPVTEENVSDCVAAYVQAGALSSLNEGGLKYMLDNGLAPTIENLYKATYSGSASYVTSASQIELSGIQQQVERIITEAGLPVTEQTLQDSRWLMANDIALTAKNITYLEDLKTQIGTVTGDELVNALMSAIAEGKSVQEAILLPNYDNRSLAAEAFSVIQQADDADVQYLIENGETLTIQKLKEAANLRMAGVLGTAEDYNEIAGNRGTSTMNQNPADVVAQAQTMDGKEIRLLTARRQLEEVRLVMTIDANYALLKRGISIDTKPLVDLVEALKNEEQQYYANLLTSYDVEATEEHVSVFSEISEKLMAIRSVPAYVLGISNADVSNVQGVYGHGTALKAALERANEKYEPLMTAPRSDLGDSINKAFQNVDDILSDLSMDMSEENRRAVRILAYNQIEISEQSVLEMKAADKEVQRVFKNLTPRVMIEMLRKGINPLEMDFATLNRTAEELKHEITGDDTQRFSEFLWKLEKNQEISEKERSSYIGVYRLIHQVEQSDGAAIGAVLHQGSELTLKNLLTAVRSGHKQKSMDYQVDDSFGERTQSGGYQNSIIDQILVGYQSNCIKDAGEALTPGRLLMLEKQGVDWTEMTPEQFEHALHELESQDAEMPEEYIREQLESLRHCANTSEEVYRLLEQYDIPNSVQNVLAMESMMAERNELFKKLFAQSQSVVGDKEQTLAELQTSEAVSMLDELAAIKQQILEEFGHAVTEPKEMAEAQEALGKLAEHVMKTMIESDEVTSIDIREARLMQAKLSIQKKMAQKETYSVPVLVGDEVTNVTLKIVRGVEKRGIVDITLESQLAGKIAATFQAKEKGISGIIATDNEAAKEDLAERLGDIINRLQVSAEGEVDVKTIQLSDLDLNQFSHATVARENVDFLTEIRSGKHSDSASEENNELYEVQTSRLYRIAETFIRTVRELYN